MSAPLVVHCAYDGCEAIAPYLTCLSTGWSAVVAVDAEGVVGVCPRHTRLLRRLR